MTVKQDIYLPRIHVASIETCGCVADFDKVDGKLTVWMTTQAPHAIRTVFALVAGHVGLAEHKIRIISPDIGGGFGGKVPVYPGLRHRGGRLGAHRQAGEVDRGPHGEPPGRLLRPRLPHHRRAGGEEGRHAHRAPRSRPRRPRLHRRGGQPVEVPGRALPRLHRLVRPQGRPRRGGRRLHQQAAGRHRLPLLVPRDRGRAHHRAHGRPHGAPARRSTRPSSG